MNAAAILGIAGMAAVALVVAVLGWSVVAHNRLVRHRSQVDAAWAQIDVQLRRRYELVPNLVATVKAYAAHERRTLDEVVRSRAGAMAAAGLPPGGRAPAENALGRTLDRVVALAEAYPTLRANEHFTRLQAELVNTEDKIAYARQFYNLAVQTYNTGIHSIPTNLVAGLRGFRDRDYFQIAGHERGPARIGF